MRFVFPSLKQYNILKLKAKIDWVWIDCYTKLPINKENYKQLKDHNIKLCLVSPELQNQEHRIEEYKKYLLNKEIYLDAICCKEKNISKWKD